MRIPITMCHGIRTVTSPTMPNPLTVGHFDVLMKIASEMGFHSITYDQLADWRDGKVELPDRPIMIDFDHPVASMRGQIFDTLERYRFKGNLFIYTSPYDPEYSRPLAVSFYDHMSWEEIRELRESGWHIGAHTVSHPNLSDLSVRDPSGEILREELDRSNSMIEENLGFRPVDFAFTGTSWSKMAEEEVKNRYRFGRLWFVGSEYQVDGHPLRVADLMGSVEEDDEDGGPPVGVRYITEDSDPYRLPSMELQALIYHPDSFRRYLEGALI